MRVIHQFEKGQSAMPNAENTLPNNVVRPVARVAIVRAESYDLGRVRAAVTESIELIGGLETIVRPGASVFVKINHLPPPSPPERGIVTHPVFAEAVIELLKAAGADVTVGDDIGSGNDGFSVTGFREVCRRVGVKLVNLREQGFVEVECRGEALDRVHIARVAVEADVIVNLPKLKTHMLTVYTGAVKNMYGTLPVGVRRRYHGEFRRGDDFSQMLTDVFAANVPQLTIMDAISAMQGEGPAGGTVRHLGIILASRDPVAVDAVAGRIIGLDPAEIDTTQHCHRRGLGIGQLEDIKVVGESLANVSVDDFQLPATKAQAVIRRVPGPLARWAVGLASIRPHVITDKCTACAECVTACPVEAIVINGGVARIDYGDCIECHCCSEVCRCDAIAARRSAVGQAVTVAANLASRIMNNLKRG
jgi:uncharacterized protein (DUF362 family)/Pyruvate/2-oxoacid:ferredoxin oxidoreductase delta subunit